MPHGGKCTSACKEKVPKIVFGFLVNLGSKGARFRLLSHEVGHRGSQSYASEVTKCHLHDLKVTSSWCENGTFVVRKLSIQRRFRQCSWTKRTTFSGVWRGRNLQQIRYQTVAHNASYFANLTLAERLVDFARFSASVLSNIFTTYSLRISDLKGCFWVQKRQLNVWYTRNKLPKQNEESTILNDDDVLRWDGDGTEYWL